MYIDNDTFGKTTLVAKESEDDINFRELFEKLNYHWKWYVISLLLSLALAYYYLKTSEKQYEVTSTIFIDDKESGGLPSELSAFEDLGILNNGTKKSIINEMGVLRSRSLMERVTKNLKLNISYYIPQKSLDFELYKKNQYIKIDFFVPDTIFDKLSADFSIFPKSKTQFQIQEFNNNLSGEVRFGEKIRTSFGVIRVNVQSLNSIDEVDEIIVKIRPIEDVANEYRSKLKLEPENKTSSLLNLSLRNNIRQRAKDVLDNLVFQYNDDAIVYKKLIAENTDVFINERINDIYIDLAEVDKGIESYKTENKLTNIEYEASLVLDSDSEIEKRIVELTSQIKLIEYIQDHIRNNKNELIPANLGIKDEATSQNTLLYNQLILERNRISKTSSKLNPTVVNLDSQIASLRQSIEQSLTNLRSSLTFSLNDAKNAESQLNYKRRNAPRQEREFQDIKRKQSIVETLYLYLLEKREENAISLGIPVPNAKIIDKANGPKDPVSPMPTLVYLIAGVLGLFIPSFIILVSSAFDNKIHTSEDVQKIMSAPIIGEIPKSKLKDYFLVKEDDNTSIAESFRLIRTNLNFMFSSQTEITGKIIFVTSTIGNEGKTFVAINLASVLSAVNSKVLVIGSDLRKPKLGHYLKAKSNSGLTQYLIDPTLVPDDIIISQSHLNFDVVLSGAIPPNPSDLLMSVRFKELLAYAKQKYDYIIVDTAPLSLVSDTLLIANQSDLLLYIIRANFVDKRILKNSENHYQSNRFKNMAIIANQINYKKKGYGYGYGYGQTNNVPWYKKLYKNT